MIDHPLDSLTWIEELLPAGFEPMPKHGGLAYFLDMKLMLILVEQPDSTYEHKDVTYPFPLWNGFILPVEYKKQNAFFLKYSFLENHPVSKDWLYIPASSENFEEEVRLLLREISKQNPLIGLAVKLNVGTKAKSSKPKAKPSSGQVKATKKGENNLLLNMLNRGKK